MITSASISGDIIEAWYKKLKDIFDFLKKDL